MMNALNWFTENRGELREALPTGAITEVEVAALNHNHDPSRRTGGVAHVDGDNHKPERASVRFGDKTDHEPDASAFRLIVASNKESAVGQTPPLARLELIAPDGRHMALPMSSERLTLGPFDQCGIWRVVTSATRDLEEGAKSAESDTTLLELACNLADRSESDVRVPKSDDATPTAVVSASLLGNRPVWFWLIAFAWLMMAVEWWAYQRRVIT
jgi:hypothetical protein